MLDRDKVIFMYWEDCKLENIDRVFCLDTEVNVPYCINFILLFKTYADVNDFHCSKIWY